ncbi:hypothetical protein ACWV26_07060 [Rummeliibacillus sp. JY-2-4R]
MESGLKHSSIFQADNFDHFYLESEGNGVPGQMPIGNFFVALLIELEAQIL